MAGRFHKLFELPVRDRCFVDPEAINRHAMAGRFFGIVTVGAHAERAAGKPDHLIQWRAGSPGFLNIGLRHGDAPPLQGYWGQ